MVIAGLLLLGVLASLARFRGRRVARPEAPLTRVRRYESVVLNALGAMLALAALMSLLVLVAAIFGAFGNFGTTAFEIVLLVLLLQWNVAFACDALAKPAQTATV